MRSKISKFFLVLVLLVGSVLSWKPKEAFAACDPYWCCDTSCSCIRRCWADLRYYGGCYCEEACVCA
jgi:hypothetical protein